MQGEEGVFATLPLPWFFAALQYQKLLPFIDNLWRAVRDKVNIMGYGAASDCDVIKKIAAMIAIILDWTRNSNFN